MADRDVIIEVFQDGVKNAIGAELIPRGASSNSLNWRTQGDKIEINRGRILQGEEVLGVGKFRGHHIGYTNNGTSVRYKKTGGSIQYFNPETELWVDVITGLTENAEYTFSNYFSLAGAFIYIGGEDGLYKICTANPTDYVSLYDESKNYKGKIIIDTARMFLFDRKEDPTGSYLSYIDSGIYSLEENEAIGAGGSLNYSGTLAFKAGGATRTCFGVSITDGVETFRDDFNGNLIGSEGGTGTINYTTGEYDITFNAVAAGNVEAEYQWENSNNKGVSDFTFETPRLAGQGDTFRHDVGGDKIQTIIVFDGKYYIFKRYSVYELNLTADDTNATNLVFRTGIGMKWHRSAISTGLGIVFLDTGDPERPKLSRLEYNINGDRLVPTDIAPDFDFSSYNFDECSFVSWGENIIFSGKTKDSQENNRVFLYNTRFRSIDILDYPCSTFVNDNGFLYGGESISDNEYLLFSGYNDDEFDIINYWDSNAERYSSDGLKRYKRLILRGYISTTQKLEVYLRFDEGDYQLVGTIRGDGTYVDYSDSTTIGSTEIGETEVGGEIGYLQEQIEVFRYVHELRINTPKFNRRSIRFKAVGFGYVSVDSQRDKRIMHYVDKLPVKYRTGAVNLDGTPKA
jgi:hypothetical protein